MWKPWPVFKWVSEESFNSWEWPLLCAAGIFIWGFSKQDKGFEKLTSHWRWEESRRKKDGTTEKIKIELAVLLKHLRLTKNKRKRYSKGQNFFECYQSMQSIIDVLIGACESTRRARLACENCVSANVTLCSTSQSCNSPPTFSFFGLLLQLSENRYRSMRWYLITSLFIYAHMINGNQYIYNCLVSQP